MAYRISSQAGKVTYNLKEFTVDTYADIADIDVRKTAPGSTAFVIDTSEHYMLNSQFKWVKVDIGGGSGVISGITSGEIEVIYDGGVVDGKADYAVIYDGGEGADTAYGKPTTYY